MSVLPFPHVHQVTRLDYAANQMVCFCGARMSAVCGPWLDRPGSAVDDEPDDDCSYQTPAQILEDSHHDAVAEFREDENYEDAPCHVDR